MKGNWQFLILAFLLAATAWFFVSGRERVDAWIELPVEFTGVQKDIVVRRGLRNKIEVRVRGPQGLVRNLDTRNVAYSLDLSAIRPGMNTVNLDSANLPLPGSIEVIEIDPPRLQVVADRIEEKVVAVIPQWSGELDEHYFLRGNETIPAVTKIRGPKEFVDRIEVIPTQVVTVEDSSPDTLVEDNVSLALPDEISADPHRVQMRLVFDVEKQAVDMKAPVRVDNFSGYDVEVDPAQVNVSLLAPVPLLEDGSLEETVAMNVVVGENLQPGVHELPYVPILPPQVTMESREPETIRVTLTPRPGARPVDNSTRSRSNTNSPTTQGLHTP
ncbi:CdaR family protein [Oceanidesulfovibrio indonesiensis]|uniref:CdaR family protein n=1 Tax=Oceanidesulfovibrio indonesiensis TaxID=54767 RepID=UPI00143158F3|nr:CdaR family protein [Oceanidesulfovibrio indonesiensis]